MSFMFVYPNVGRSNTPQLGILQLASLLLDHGYDSFVCDLTFVSQSRYLDHVLADIERKKPEIVGLGVRSMEFSLARMLATEVKKRYKDILVVMGGPQATYSPDETAPCVDFGVIGDGEDACLAIAEAVAEGKRDSIESIPNVFFQKDEEVVKVPLGPMFDISKSPMARYGLFDDRHYTNHSFRGIVPHAEVCGVFEGSRGCPYRCTYCANPALMDINKGGGTWRREKPGVLLRKEIDEFKSRYGMDMMYFVDEVIMTTDDRTLDLKEHLEDLKTPFVFMERPELIRETRVQHMKAAGAYSCSIGVESGDEEFRKNLLLRKISDVNIKKAYQLMHAYDIHTHAFIMMGLPEQTPEIMASTFKLLEELQPTTAQATTFFPLPGTVLYYKVKKDGLYDKDLYPRAYYGSSLLNYPRSHKRKINQYAHMVNLYLWQDGPGRWWRKGLAELCMRIPYLSSALYYGNAVYRSIGSTGIRQTFRKVRGQTAQIMLHTGGTSVGGSLLTKGRKDGASVGAQF